MVLVQADSLTCDAGTPLPCTTHVPKALARSDIWFSDGNIVLVAGSAAFKVHRGQLERQSEVFRDLFSLPQPEDPNQTLVDGCPAIDLYDCPSDIYHLLVALYDGLYFPKHQANDFAFVAAVLRLSTKYLIEHLRQRCLARLELDWPLTLVDWDRREAEATQDDGRYLPREAFAHPILVINLAFELDLPDFLPSAFYDLSRYGPSKIVVGTPAPPLTFPVSDPSVAPLVDGKPAMIHLSHGSLCRTLRGRERAQRYVPSFLERAFKDRPSANCIHAGRTTALYCLESFYFIQLNVLRSVGGIACGRDADPLYTLVQAAEMLDRKDFSDGVNHCGLRMCWICKEEFKISLKEAREQVWKLIPQWFELA